MLKNEPADVCVCVRAYISVSVCYRDDDTVSLCQHL